MKAILDEAARIMDLYDDACRSCPDSPRYEIADAARMAWEEARRAEKWAENPERLGRIRPETVWAWLESKGWFALDEQTLCSGFREDCPGDTRHLWSSSRWPPHKAELDRLAGIHNLRPVQVLAELVAIQADTQEQAAQEIDEIVDEHFWELFEPDEAESEPEQAENDLRPYRQEYHQHPAPAEVNETRTDVRAKRQRTVRASSDVEFIRVRVVPWTKDAPE